MAVTLARHRFTADEYHKMGETGILGPEDRVELIEGEIVDMPPIGRRHMSCVDLLTHLFVLGPGNEAIVRVQGAIRLNIRSEPQPDLIVLRPRADFYRDVDATPDDVLLLVEVADTTVNFDRRVKVPLYARAGIRELWLVDLTSDSVTVYPQPRRGSYADVAVVRGDDELSPLAFPNFTLTPARIFG